MRKDVEDIRAL